VHTTRGEPSEGFRPDRVPASGFGQGPRSRGASPVRLRLHRDALSSVGSGLRIVYDGWHQGPAHRAWPPPESASALDGACFPASAVGWVRYGAAPSDNPLGATRMGMTRRAMRWETGSPAAKKDLEKERSPGRSGSSTHRQRRGTSPDSTTEQGLEADAPDPPTPTDLEPATEPGEARR